jgi:O-antigen ligase
MNELKNNIIFKFTSLLIVLMPLFLISGPFLSDLSVIIISIVFLYYSLKTRNMQYFKSNFFLLFLIFFLYILFNSIILNPSLYSFVKSLTYIRFGLFALAVWFFVDLNQKILDKIFYVFCFCFTVLVLDGFYQYFNGYNILGYKAHGGIRLSSFFGDEYILGSYLSRFFPIMFGLMISRFYTNKYIILLISFLFVLTESVIFLSGERAAFILLNLSGIYLIFMIRGKFKFIRFSTMVLSFLVLIFITSVNDNAKKRMIDQTLNQLQTKDNQIISLSKEHESIFKTSYSIFLDNKIFGSGIGKFKKLCGDYRYYIDKNSCSTHSHNTYLQLLAELGFVGFILIFGIFIFFIYTSIKHIFTKINYNNFQICIISAFLITLWPFTPTGNFFSNWLSIVYFYPIGLFLWSLKNNSAANKKI